MNDDIKRIAEQIKIQENPAIEELRRQAIDAQAAIPREALESIDRIPKYELPEGIASATIAAQEITQRLGDIAKTNAAMLQRLQANGALASATRTVVEAIQKYADMSSMSSTLVARLQDQIRVSMGTVTRVFENFKFSIPEGVFESLKNIAEKARPLSVITKLSESQYVYWDYLEDDFIEIFYNCKNVNKALREYHEKDKFLLVDATVDKCSALLIDKHTKRLFEQAVSSYKNNQHDIAAVGFVSVIDGLLTSVSGDTGTSIFKRADAILVRIEHDDEISSEEYSIVALTWTFRKTMESLCASSDFTGKEPMGLNRHWISHGRSKRRKTRLDCIKLINFIYGTLLVSAFGEREYCA